eukprot:688256-Hanusia_phi.AAC.1
MAVGGGEAAAGWRRRAAGDHEAATEATRSGDAGGTAVRNAVLVWDRQISLLHADSAQPTASPAVPPSRVLSDFSRAFQTSPRSPRPPPSPPQPKLPSTSFSRRSEIDYQGSQSSQSSDREPSPLLLHEPRQPSSRSLQRAWKGEEGHGSLDHRSKPPLPSASSCFSPVKSHGKTAIPKPDKSNEDSKAH